MVKNYLWFNSSGGETNLEPCNHTKLMNYIIGMCKKHKDWVSVLADLGYEPNILEQRIRTSSDETVKPDIVTTSNKLLHFLVLECKGGITIEEDQLRRYATLTKDNLCRWVDVFAPNDFNLDVCLSDLEENHHFIMRRAKGFPIITFGKDEITKTGKFNEIKLNSAFQDPISLKGKIPPLLYYPFCEDDKNAYIAPFVIRGLVSIAFKKSKGGPSVLDEGVITNDEIIRRVFNPIFDLLSNQHRKSLKERIKEVIRWVLAIEGMKEALGLIEQQAGYKTSRPLEKLVREAEIFIAHLQTQRPLIDFMEYQSPHD